VVSPAKKNRVITVVVIPAFNVADQVVSVIQKIDQSVSKIIVVDDKCPQKSGTKINQKIKDKRLQIIFNEKNLGVGGSMCRGYTEALKMNPTYIVKLDGDGQMDPKLIPRFIDELEKTGADYAKGNRFADPENLKTMPKVRILGNLVLSFFAKFSTGYWNVFDPNNGFTVIRGDILNQIPLNKISDGYFFESDMLFRLNLIGAEVIDIPMKPIYGEEKSNLRISKSLFEFTFKHNKNFIKRIAYNYFLRDFNLASMELILAVNFLLFGTILGAINLIQAIKSNSSMSVGLLVLISILIISGIQLILNFFNFDMSARGRKQPR
jgi:dolichol-phosphate mannosyltransferase